MNSEQTLELQIKSKAEEAKSSIDTLVKSLTNVENVLTNIYLELGQIEKKSSKSQTTVNYINNIKSSADKTTTSVSKLGNALSLTGAYLAAKRLTNTVLSWMNEAVDYTEQLNLFNVVFDNIEKNGVQTFSTLGKEATQFQYKLNEAFGTNKTQTFYMQGIFQSMGESVGIPETYSAIMSETMTKLAYDLASLYNKTEKDTAEALRAGVYAGQTKPLRSYGIDVTQQTLQPILESLGIDDRTVKQMSQAEKEILRYIATLKQGQIAMGDLANTIESPSNQIKVFRQQLVETKVAISGLFMGIFSNILPYINAFLMVIKEISKAIADMFGIELADYNSGIASQEDAFVDFEDSVDGATDAVKELKRQTLGFDQINNINENNDSGSGSGSNLVGGIDQRLLDAITGYDNGMESVRMKATQIRDSIMEWLGFTKEIDPLTGEVSFKYGGIDKTIKNIWNWFKKLNVQGKILVGLGLLTLVGGLFSGVKKLSSALGNSGLFSVIKNLLSPVSRLGGYLKVYTNLAGKEGLTGVNKLTDGIKQGTTAWQNNLSIMDKAKNMLVGGTGIVVGFALTKDAIADVSEEGWNLSNSLQTALGGLSSIAGGALAGSTFGTWGAIIGGAVGAVSTLIAALQGYNDEMEISKQKIDEYNENLKEQFAEIEESYNGMNFSADVHQALFDELDALVDANGKVKEGYEDRAQFIITTLNDSYDLEIEMIDGVIQEYDKQKQAIQEVINKKKEEIATNMAAEKYEVALKEQTNAYYNMVDAQNKYNEKHDELIAKEKELREEWDSNYMVRRRYNDSFDEFLEAMMDYNRPYSDLVWWEEELRKSLEESEQSYYDTQEAIMTYEGIVTASANNNAEAVEDYVNRLLAGTDAEITSYKNAMEEAKKSYETRLQNAKDTGQEITDTVINQAESRFREYATILTDEVQRVKEITPDYASAWGILAENSKNTFLTYFAKLPEDIQQEVINKMYEQGYSISEELQKGITQINPTIKVDADISSATEKLTNLENKINNLNIKDKLSNIFGNAIAVLTKENGGVYSAGSWKAIPQYANGGAPSHGTLFWAGENGAEVVAHANGRTEVLNQSQIASTIYSAMVSAMSQFGGQSSQIDVHVHSDEGVIVDRVNQKTKQTGVFPFVMPTR